MKKDIEYIDKLVEDKLSNLKKTPELQWAVFSSKFSGKLQASTSLFSSANNIITVKNATITVISLSVLATGIILYSNSETEKDILKSTNKIEKVETKTDIQNKEIKDKLIQNENVSNNKFLKDSTSSIKESKNKDVIVKIKVPVHKEVKIKKEIIIDTISD